MGFTEVVGDNFRSRVAMSDLWGFRGGCEIKGDLGQVIDMIIKNGEFSKAWWILSLYISS